jgi:hypothetical protein
MNEERMSSVASGISIFFVIINLLWSLFGENWKWKAIASSLFVVWVCLFSFAYNYWRFTCVPHYRQD